MCIYIPYTISIVYILCTTHTHTSSGDVKEEKHILSFLKRPVIHESCYNKSTDKVCINTRERERNFIQGLWKLYGENRIGLSLEKKNFTRVPVEGNAC